MNQQPKPNPRHPRAARNRSKKPYGHKQEVRNPIFPRTLDEDLAEIKEQAANFDNVVDAQMKEILVSFVFPGKSLEYYHGAYTAWYQAYILAYQSDNDMSQVLGPMLHALASQIVKTLEETAKTAIKDTDINVYSMDQ